MLVLMEKKNCPISNSTFKVWKEERVAAKEIEKESPVI